MNQSQEVPAAIPDMTRSAPGCPTCSEQRLDQRNYTPANVYLLLEGHRFSYIQSSLMEESSPNHTFLFLVGRGTIIIIIIIISDSEEHKNYIP